jgi:MYXO-CTERM domain-containing protein
VDEARYEVDFWLRLRDGKEYGHGLTNPNSKNEFFQAGTSPVAAWANAANAAMLADAFRIAGNKALADQYTAAAVEAYSVASAAADPLLDKTLDAGGAIFRGRDLKMTAAAYLYNVTGDTTYEEVVKTESVCTSATAEIFNSKRNQLWATAGYLMTPQPVHQQALWDTMKAAVLGQAKSFEIAKMEARPSRRSTNDDDGYFRTTQNVPLSLVAHAVATDAADKALFRKALALEADWGLGRNPANLIEMGVSTTPLEGKRGMRYMYTAGVDDGVPGTTPGQTPYCNLDDWDTSMTMGSPTKLYSGAYPANVKTTWPIGETCFETPWVWAHSEFTPQQTMRGKTALYGYLYGISPGNTPIATGGVIAATGGTTGGGGTIATGGVKGSGGIIAAGGALASGGIVASGGARSGGVIVATGGRPTSTGGVVVVASGGVVTVGGVVVTTGGDPAATGGNTIPTGGTGTTPPTTPNNSGCGCRLGSPTHGHANGLMLFGLAFLALVFRKRSRG